jgi:hypothetical protein
MNWSNRQTKNKLGQTWSLMHILGSVLVLGLHVMGSVLVAYYAWFLQPNIFSFKLCMVPSTRHFQFLSGSQGTCWIFLLLLCWTYIWKQRWHILCWVRDLRFVLFSNYCVVVLVLSLCYDWDATMEHDRCWILWPSKQAEMVYVNEVVWYLF